MKNKIISIIQALVLLWGVTSCHSPEELGLTFNAKVSTASLHRFRTMTAAKIVSKVR